MPLYSVGQPYISGRTALARLYARYPDTRALQAAATVRTRGGT